MPGRSLPKPKRYAQAVYEIAQAADTLDEWQETLAAMATACRNPDFVAMLEAPGITPAEKAEAIRAVLPDAGDLAHNLLGLLVQRRATGIVPQVHEHYQELLDRARGVQRVEVTSAVDLAEADRERIAGQISGTLGRSVRLTATVEPSLLGGLLVRVGDRVLDGSVRGSLLALRQSFTSGAS